MSDVIDIIKGMEEVKHLIKCENLPAHSLEALLIMDDAITLLKAQESIEARLHLCESCTKEYPECDATIDGIEFGCGVGNDNIIGCTAYVNRWKAQEPVEPVPAIDDVGDWLCGKCYNSVVGTEELDEGGFVPIRFNYCPNCGQAVKWE